MEIRATLKEDMSLDQAIQTLKDIQEKEDRINKDPHTNKHYELHEGRIWMKGNGTGKYWDYLCNSREAQHDAQKMMLR